jgi:retinoid hydroxylase
MKTTQNKTLPPGTLGLPFIGETLSFLKDSSFAKKRHQQYGAIFKSSIFGSPTIFVEGPAANQFVLTHENEYFIVKWPPSTTKLLGDFSLALQQGSIHQKRRKLIYQVFQPRAIAGYIDTMESLTQSYCDNWVKMETLTWYNELRNYTFDIACKLFVGMDGASQRALGHAFEAWTNGLFSIPINLPWTRFGRAWRSRQFLLGEIEKMIRQRQQDNLSDVNDALSLLINATDDDGNALSIEELKDQILVLLFAGHETLTSAIASFCLLMVQHPEVLKKVRDEQEKFKEESLTLETLKQMTYLEQVLKEVLRFVPPVGGGFRQIIETCEFQGYELPKGWNISYGINLTHKDKDVYENPETFDPERFSPERASGYKPFSFVTFGGGMRECIGKEFARLEMKIFAVKLARYYQWELLPDQDINLIPVPTPHPVDGLRVKFAKLT